MSITILSTVLMDCLDAHSILMMKQINVTKKRAIGKLDFPKHSGKQTFKMEVFNWNMAYPKANQIAICNSKMIKSLVSKKTIYMSSLEDGKNMVSNTKLTDIK